MMQRNQYRRVQFIKLSFTAKENLPPIHLVYNSNTPKHLLRFFNKTLPHGEHAIPVQWNADLQELQFVWVSSLKKRHVCKLNFTGEPRSLKFYFDEKLAPVTVGLLDTTLPDKILLQTLPTLVTLIASDVEERHPHRHDLQHHKDVSQGLNVNKKLTGKFCYFPFQHVEIMHGWGDRNDGDIGYGNVHVCCMSLVSKPVGNYLEQSMEEIWNSKTAQDIRHSILDGSYKYCNHQLCPLIQSDTLTNVSDLNEQWSEVVANKQVVVSSLPQRYLLCFDRSCNLSCPSCRTHKIVHGQGKEFDKATYLTEKLIEDLFSKPHNNVVKLMITGSGDPFASKVYRRLIESINGADFPNLQLDLFTNGVLLTPEQWQKLERVHQNIAMISISIDAATAETYKKVRGGDWSQLMENMSFLGELLKTGQIKNFETNFVVQKTNYHEMAQFVRLCNSKNVQAINFSPLVDWKTWESKEFKDQCVWRQDHPLLPNLINELRSPELSHPSVRLGALASYRQLALQNNEMAQI